MNLTLMALAMLVGLAMAQVATQVPPEKLAKAYQYELLLEPLEETKLPPPPPDWQVVRKAFVEKMGVIDLVPVSASQAEKAGWTYLLYTEGPLPETDIQEILKTTGLRASRIDPVSSPENPEKQ